MTKNLQPTATKKLRDAVKRSKMTQNQLSAETEIAQSSLSVFLSGGGIQLDRAERIAAAIGCNLIIE